MRPLASEDGPADHPVVVRKMDKFPLAGTVGGPRLHPRHAAPILDELAPNAFWRTHPGQCHVATNASVASDEKCWRR